MNQSAAQDHAEVVEEVDVSARVQILCAEWSEAKRGAFLMEQGGASASQKNEENVSFSIGSYSRLHQRSLARFAHSPPETDIELAEVRRSMEEAGGGGGSPSPSFLLLLLFAFLFDDREQTGS